MDRKTYDSRSLRHKRPYGAVPSGTKVEMMLTPPRSRGYSRGNILAQFEADDGREVAFPLTWTGMEGSRDCFTGTLDTGDYVGLVWYRFRLESLDGRLAESETFQLTVYDDSERVPDWFGQGLTYQIFPDRFRRTRVPDPTGMVGGRTVHENWEEEPEYRPNAQGEIRNRDFFGGDLNGVREKLPYLKSLGVETIYFNPIFEAAENHRYGTADYGRVDPMLGTNEDFSALCEEAHRLGMRVLLDGVFNHTGYVSRYFNGDGFYPEPGAAQSKDSPYYKWFHFSRWPDHYDSWWGIYSLPAVNETSESYLDYIIEGEASVIRSWLRAGADGWRLDVADELPDGFIERLHAAVRETDPNAVVIGEVWDDGTTKGAYDVRRKHLLGRHLDGLMNYPFRNALLAFLMGGDAAAFRNEMEKLRENYPPFAFHGAMNFLGTHDTPRILTLLGVGGDGRDHDRDWRAACRLDEEQYNRAVTRLKAGATILYAFPGSPTLYYGDEAGLEGFEDPFNRRTYPWGREDGELVDFFRTLGQARATLPALRKGDLTYVAAEEGFLAFTRSYEKQTVLAAANLSCEEKTLTVCGKTVQIPPMTSLLREL